MYSRVRLIHCKAGEAAGILQILRSAGFRVEYEERFTSALMRQWRASPPDAFVIDLSRLPSQGREIAIALRQSPKTRSVPIIFCGGDPQKVEALRTVMPDAVYSNEHGLVKALRNAKPLQQPLRPAAMMDRYAGRTALQKLAVPEDGCVRVVNAPAARVAALDGVRVVDEAAAVTLCFVHSVDELRQTVADARQWAAKTRLWVLWQKKSAPGHNGVTEGLVRDTGLSLGLVDYKICSVDKTWSAMLFAKRSG